MLEDSADVPERLAEGGGGCNHYCDRLGDRLWDVRNSGPIFKIYGRLGNAGRDPSREVPTPADPPGVTLSQVSRAVLHAGEHLFGIHRFLRQL